MRGLLALLGLVALVPSGAACSMISEPPAPGFFYLWEPMSGWNGRVEVDERFLGAACELSNLQAHDANRLVWVDGPDDAPYLAVFEVATGERSNHPLDGRLQRLGVAGTRGAALLERRVVLVDLETGQVADAGSPSMEWWLVDGIHAAGARDEGREVAVYDAVERRLVFGPKPVRDLGLPSSQAYLTHFEFPWLVFAPQSGAGVWAIHALSNRFVDLTNDGGQSPDFIGLDEGWAYVHAGPHDDRSLNRIRLTDGATEALGRPDVPIPWHASLGGGLVVLPFYSDPGHVEPRGPGTQAPQPPEGEDTVQKPFTLPFPGLATLIAAVLVALRSRR